MANTSNLRNCFNKQWLKNALEIFIPIYESNEHSSHLRRDDIRELKIVKGDTQFQEILEFDRHVCRAGGNFCSNGLRVRSQMEGWILMWDIYIYWFIYLLFLYFYIYFKKTLNTYVYMYTYRSYQIRSNPHTLSYHYIASHHIALHYINTLHTLHCITLHS